MFPVIAVMIALIILCLGHVALPCVRLRLPAPNFASPVTGAGQAAAAQKSRARPPAVNTFSARPPAVNTFSARRYAQKIDRSVGLSVALAGRTGNTAGHVRFMNQITVQPINPEGRQRSTPSR